MSLTHTLDLITRILDSSKILKIHFVLPTFTLGVYILSIGEIQRDKAPLHVWL